VNSNAARVVHPVACFVFAFFDNLGRRGVLVFLDREDRSGLGINMDREDRPGLERKYGQRRSFWIGVGILDRGHRNVG